MAEGQPPVRIGPFILIGVIVAVIAAAFAYVAGWLSPDRLTPAKLVGTLAPPQGPALGFRRNHAKGICFAGEFAANGNGSALSKAAMFVQGTYPVIGRFNLATNDPHQVDGMARVRGLSLDIKAGTQEWRSAMIDAPFFAVATPEAFYGLQKALADKGNPTAVKDFIGQHPEFGAFAGWAGTAPFTGSYAEERYNGLNSFIFTDDSGADHAVRWSFVPVATPVTVTADDLKSRDVDFLEKEIVDRQGKEPVKFTMVVQVANAGDPTADPTKVWPADRKTVEVGTLAVTKIEQEADGPCRDINFDPTVLPPGIHVSDDPFPAARSAVYAVSFDHRTAEEKDYPRGAEGEKK
jgi:catalase